MSQMGSNPVVPVMSAARPLFPRKRTSICDLAMSHSCQNLTHALQQARLYSITSSARASTEVGTSRPSAFAVLRLIVSSYLVGACTGRSAGFSPSEGPFGFL
jgi:hypothetical protein